MRLSTLNLIRRAKPIRRLGARLLQVMLLVWFLAHSVGLPVGLLSLRSAAQRHTVLVPMDDCQCSLKKKMSGTCCCNRRDTASMIETTTHTASTPAVVEFDLTSCCAKRQPKAVATKLKSCCSSKLAARAEQQSSKLKPSSSSDVDAAHIRAIHRCGCHSSSDWEWHAWSIVALPIRDFEPLFLTVTADLMPAASRRLPSLRHEPPVPPPRAC